MNDIVTTLTTRGPHRAEGPSGFGKCAACDCRGPAQGRLAAPGPGQDKKVKLVLVYPMTTGRNFDEVLRVIDPPVSFTGAVARTCVRG